VASNVRAGRPSDNDDVFCHGHINARCEHGEFAWSTKGSSQVGLNITPRRGVRPQRREGGRPRFGKLRAVPQRDALQGYNWKNLQRGHRKRGESFSDGEGSQN
jgi:hypothetical protein